MPVAVDPSVSDLGNSPFAESINKRLRGLKKRLSKIEKYEQSDSALLNADQQQAIQRKPEITSIIKELEDVSKQVTLLEQEQQEQHKLIEALRLQDVKSQVQQISNDLELKARGKSEAMLRVLYALNVALRSACGSRSNADSSSISSGSLEALMLLKGVLTVGNASQEPVSINDFIQDSLKHFDLLQSRSSDLFLGSSLSYDALSGLLDDILSPRTHSLQFINADDAVELNENQEAQPVHMPRFVSSRLSSSISFFTPSEVLGQ